MQAVDIVIVGGGMAGSALACGLRNSGWRVAIVEKQPLLTKEAIQRQPAVRVSAINAASERWLTHIGAWETILSLRGTAYQAMEVWDKDSFGHIQFHAQESGLSHLGHIIENQVIQYGLWEQLQRIDPPVHIEQTSVSQIIWGENEVFLTLENGHLLTGKLVVAADGAHSQLRQLANIPLTFWEYGHHALVATIRTVLPHQGCARQIFHGNGILAFLPLWERDLCSIVWSVPAQRAKELQNMDPEQFNKELAVAFDMQLGICELQSERQVIPLMARYARDFAAHRLVLVGDAAHTIHPLAGQGVNLGLMDTAELVAELVRLQQEGKDIGQHMYLRRYERRRKLSALKMLAAMQGFRNLFDGHHPLKKLARDVGLSLAETSPRMKSLLVRQAMGMHDLPSLFHTEHHII